MSWYDKNYRYRLPVSVAASAGSQDVQLTVPKTLDLFWDVVLSNGYDIRITDSDGYTDVTWDRTTWDYANKSGVLSVQAWTPTGAGCATLWLYWGYASATDAASVFTPSTPSTGVLSMQAPGTPLVRASLEKPQALEPSQGFQITTGESKPLYLDVSALLARGIAISAGSEIRDEVALATYSVRSTADADQSITTDTDIRVTSRKRGRGDVLICPIDATATLQDGSDYVVSVHITTAAGYIYDSRTGLYVRNVRPR